MPRVFTPHHPVRVVHTVSAVREAVRGWRAAGEAVGFVPTMGNLHAGHLSLTELAASESDRVVASVFVNPTQFGPNEDFAAYPRTLEDDTAKLSAAGTVDLLFAPEEREVYPFGIERSVRVTLPPLSRELCGASRPGHFEGVASVVCRLLNIVAPNTLVLGHKDYQQAVLVHTMITDLRMPIALRIGPTRRDPDGVAMSSRNRYLGPEERAAAPKLHAVIANLSEQVQAGDTDYPHLQQEARAELAAAGFKPDYVEVRRASDLAKPIEQDATPGNLIVLAAAWLGKTRLIDNVRI